VLVSPPELPERNFMDKPEAGPTERTPPHGGADAPPAAPYEGRWIAMAVMLMAGFMNLIDVTIVNVALPSLQADLGASDTGIEWVVAAYILSFSIGLLPFGRLGDLLGRRRVFLAGVGCFTVASTLCGMAPNIEMLIVARVAQGFSAAIMTPQTLAIAQVIFSPQERGTAFSLFGLTAGLATVTGPLLGGVLIGADIGGLNWRPIFLVNIPIGIIAILAGLRFIPRSTVNRDVGFDIVGILLAMGTMLLLVFPLVEGRNFGWPSWIFLMLASSVPMGFLFARWQKARAAAGRPQLMPASVLGNRQFLGGAMMTTLLFSSVPGLFLVLAVFLQIGFGLTPLQSGLTTMPYSIGVLTASLVANRFGGRFMRQRVVGGALLLCSAMLGLRYVAGTIEGDLVMSHFIPPLLAGGLGLGTTIPALFQTVLANVQGRDAGSASGSLQSFQQAGAALGVAVMGQIFFGHFGGSAAGSEPGLFIEALRAALLYSVAAFSVVVLGGLVIRSPQQG
jgi:EmrB/QacA subfamily drug resistance transporter